ncbi:MAG: ACT domain-containing protein [Clostridia bacterium]|nr:ACT domain-containing protein [Clostridia bacterium]
MAMKKLTLSIMHEKLGICRLESGLPLPDWVGGSKNFYAITGTADETSIVCREDLIPAGLLSENNFRALKVNGPLAFSLTGILASLLNPLAAAGISVFAVSTYNTDYILIKEKNLEQAIGLLSATMTIRR